MSDHYVYVIAHLSDGKLRGPVKIGISANPLKRISTLQTSCPFKIEVSFIFACPNREWAKMVEKSFHETQKESCLHGEWFDIEPIQAIHILCIGYRVCLQHFVKDTKIHNDCLRTARVLEAEEFFSLATPSALQ